MSEVSFPITVKFENGEIETYENVNDIEQNLEDFDSESAEGCEVRDRLGQNIHLVVRLLKVDKLAVK